jgi:hypothetical protein
MTCSCDVVVNLCRLVIVLFEKNNAFTVLKEETNTVPLPLHRFYHHIDGVLYPVGVIRFVSLGLK